MSEAIDEEFFACVLEELRDGEHVTVRTRVAPARVKATLRRLGATDDDLSELEIVR